MRGFAIALAYNRDRLIGDTDLASMYTYIGIAPLWIGEAGAEATLQFKADLLSARDLLKDAYMFDANVVEGW